MSRHLGDPSGAANDADRRDDESRAHAGVDGADGSEPRIPVDAPGEPSVRTASTVGLWAIVLFGPVAWITHFMFVYLAAEASCTATRSTQMSFLDPDDLTVVVVAATVVVLGGIGIAGWHCRRRLQDEQSSPMYRIGLLLALLSALATFVVGFPALVLDPC